ncbi:hypothetical protein DFH06DRAFT_1345934 [Mycena polygramma]|nr:hypothetical protein DFH06DRAFT_1345934 [Mycena polygramma]
MLSYALFPFHVLSAAASSCSPYCAGLRSQAARTSYWRPFPRLNAPHDVSTSTPFRSSSAQHAHASRPPLSCAASATSPAVPARVHLLPVVVPTRILQPDTHASAFPPQARASCPRL